MKQISDGNLKPSDNVKNGKHSDCIHCLLLLNAHCLLSLPTVITMMNSKYKMLLIESKKLNGSGLLQKASANNITADRILYEYAIQMVRMACAQFNWINKLMIFSLSLGITVSISRFRWTFWQTGRMLSTISNCPNFVPLFGSANRSSTGQKCVGKM